jgi:hypothetical protein
MSALGGVTVDTFDWTIDALRGVCGFPPLPPQLVKLAFDRQPTVRVSTSLHIEARRTMHACVRIEQDGLVLFEGAPPHQGSIGVLPLTSGLMRVHVSLESRHPMARHGSTVTEAIFEPLPNGPKIERFDAPSKVLFGNSIACAWHVPAAERVRLAVIEDGNVDERTGPPSGQMLLKPARPGRLLLRLTAESGWGQTTILRSVKVVPPKLRITLLRPATQSGHPGEKVSFFWEVSGADEGCVWLEARGDRQRVLPQDGVGVVIGHAAEEMHLIATARGRTRIRRMAAIPRFLTALDQDF